MLSIANDDYMICCLHVVTALSCYQITLLIFTGALLCTLTSLRIRAESLNKQCRTRLTGLYICVQLLDSSLYHLKRSHWNL